MLALYFKVQCRIYLSCTHLNIFLKQDGQGVVFFSFAECTSQTAPETQGFVIFCNTALKVKSSIDAKRPLKTPLSDNRCLLCHIENNSFCLEHCDVAQRSAKRPWKQSHNALFFRIHFLYKIGKIGRFLADFSHNR